MLTGDLGEDLAEHEVQRLRVGEERDHLAPQPAPVEVQDIEPFADQMTGGKTQLPFQEFVFNVFANSPIPYAVMRPRGWHG